MRRVTLMLSVLISMISCRGAEREESVSEMAARLLIVGVSGQSLTDDNPIIGDIRDRGVSGVILFGSNVATTDTEAEPRAKLERFISDLKALRREPLLVAVDQEGGFVNRLKTKSGFKPMVSHRKVGEAANDEYTREVAHTIASEVASVGFNLNFAPCVDLDINPECPVIGHFERSFSADVSEVSRAASIYVDEHRKAGVLTSLKHFPGHGSSLDDSHFGLTDITNTWSRAELEPYTTLMQEGECDAIMVSHLFNSRIDDQYPATLSKLWLNGLLRSELGWDGVVISDDMQMQAITDHYGFEEAIILSLNAGVDLFIIGNNITRESFSVTERFVATIEAGVESGEISMETLSQAVERVKLFISRLEE